MCSSKYPLVLLLSLAVSLVHCEDVQIKYFESVILSCDDNQLNLTSAVGNSPKIQNKYWLLPSGSLVDNKTQAPVVDNEHEWTLFGNFSLEINSVNDEDFGVYCCVVVLSDNTIRVIRQGLNVNGPYYGDLLEQYRQNAIIGGIAAGVVFVIISGSCALWHYRYTARKSRSGKDGLETKAFDNAAMNIDSKENVAESDRL